jgi:hypothetical protein
MKASLLLLLFAIALPPAFGQAPWAYVDGFSDGYYSYMQYLRAPQANVLWGMATSYPMMQTSGSSVFRTIDNGQTWEKAGVAGYGRVRFPGLRASCK